MRKGSVIFQTVNNAGKLVNVTMFDEENESQIFLIKFDEDESSDGGVQLTISKELKPHEILGKFDIILRQFDNV